MTTNDELLGFVSAVIGDTHLKVEEDLGEGFVRLKVAEAERRQAKHDIRSVEDIVVELLRNARDAHARRIFVATTREGDERRLTVIDDGVGIPRPMHERIFEPRVTSKLDSMVMDRWGVHGRGMALFSIRSNSRAASVAASAPHRGAAVRVVVDCTQLTERADQSTWPELGRDGTGTERVLRGPHNIARRVVEFALEHPGIDLYLGSPTEVLATLVLLARFELDERTLLRCRDLEDLAVWQRPGAAADALELTMCGEAIGLPVSERTAHRILAGEVVGLTPVLSLVTANPKAGMRAERPDLYRDPRGLKIDPRDLDAFRIELEKVFDLLAHRYYLQLREAPRITVGKDEIRVRFPIDKED